MSSKATRAAAAGLRLHMGGTVEFGRVSVRGPVPPKGCDVLPADVPGSVVIRAAACVLDLDAIEAMARVLSSFAKRRRAFEAAELATSIVGGK